jgi:hypothetical protein
MCLVRTELVTARHSRIRLHSRKIKVQIRRVQAFLDNIAKDCAVGGDGIRSGDGGGEFVTGGGGINV